MPRVVQYTPRWLSRPSPGFDLFNAPSSGQVTNSAHLNNEEYVGPRRTIAARGTEIFVVVDNELRWSDLTLLRAEWEQKASVSQGSPAEVIGSDNGGDTECQYRVLRIPVHRDIKQLIVSPYGNYLAILTTHTVHVAILPDSSHLAAEDTSPLRLKTFQIGPTTHVLERSAIASVLWHPLGALGSCLVTVTADAVVRIWELDRDNRWSFDAPTLAIDLKKLADGVSASEDFTPSKYGANKAFSPDSFEMEVASACFGGLGDDSENPWASMTLVVAMRAGDIYALSPLLPSKWEASSSLSHRLAFSTALKAAALEDDDTASAHMRMVYEQQSVFVSELGSEEPQAVNDDSDERPSEMYSRPTKPGPVPRLQGPLQFAPDPDKVSEISDVFVIPASDEFSTPTEDSASESAKGFLPVALICIATSDGNVHVCLNMKPIEGQWLPAKVLRSQATDPDSDAIDLLVLQSLTVCNPSPTCWATFTRDVQSQYALFVTHSAGVSHVSMTPWIAKITDELSSESDPGSDLRVNVLLGSTECVLEQLISIPGLPSISDVSKAQYVQQSTSQELIRADLEHSQSPAPTTSSCIILSDIDLGFLVLTSADKQPYAATLDDAELDLASLDALEYSQDIEFHPHEPRPVYQPPQDFWVESELASFMEKHGHGHSKRFMSEEVRLSPVTLNLMTEAHRVLSRETYKLGVAAADLFSRCQRLQDEFQLQIKQANRIATRIDSVLDDDADAYDSSDELDGAGANVERRLSAVRAQQTKLTERFAELRHKLGRLNGRPLNDKEQAWMEEVQVLEHQVIGEEEEVLVYTDAETIHAPRQRYREVVRLKKELEERYSKHSRRRKSGLEEFGVENTPVGTKKTKSTQIALMLERETALVDAAMKKLEKLSLLSR